MKCEGLLAPEYRRFSVDPQITSFEVLQSLLARAFDIKGEFSISYYARDEEGKDTYLSLLSDWDLDAAFLGSSDPCLQLKVDLKPFEEGLEDWDVVAPIDVSRNSNTGFLLDRSSITGTILNHMEKTFNMVQRALNLSEGDSESDSFKPVKQPMVDGEFHTYLDSEGRLVKPRELRLSVYQRGIDPALRKVVWKHILNVYPHGLTAKERISYMKQRSSEYQKLRQTWQDMISNGNLTEEIQYVTNMVRKDVLRTDRTHKFYAGSDDNKNVVSLFNILTTYALNHPSVSYCQGMSDLASLF
ncbi:TBC1 domain family member 25 [Caerostris extrusa]|uniref:TBC1 domain family member 25 n=1 Tax=Caerostris extrusa TaxID=172846 RepID=A0AAV4PED9_CAEEX|nr:TBC1 domain family member 25 [Caerostris extrusa]